MKGKIYALSVAGLLSLFGAVLLVKNNQKPVYQSKDYSGLHNDMGSAKYAIQYRQLMLQDKNGEINLSDILKARRAFDRHYSSKAPADRMFFEEMGPNFVGGRTRGLIQDNQDGNESILYAGSVGGGVWVTYNSGEQWQGYSGDLTNLFIGDVGQTSDGTLFVGTGEGFGSTGGPISSSVFTGDGLFRRAFDGNGLMSYERIIGPSSRPSQPGSDWATIQRVIGHPTDANKLYVGTSRGLMVTSNAQASASEVAFFNGIEIANGIFMNGFIDDIAISNDGSILYVVAGGTIYKLNDTGGSNITLLNKISLPTGVGGLSRIAVATAPSDNNVIYAAASSNGSGGTCTYGIYQSKDAGDSWTTIGPGAPVSLYQSAGCQGFWDNTIAVYPNDAGKILVGGVSIYKWEESKTVPGTGGWYKAALLQTEGTSGSLTDTNYVHADKHRILILDSNTVYVASDGGIGRSLDGGKTWGQNNNGFNVTQFYSVTAAFGVNLDSLNLTTEQVMGGSQDNGTWLIGINPSRLDNGFRVNGGDGFDAEFSNIASLGFVTSQNLNLRRVTIGGGSQSFFDAEIRNICQGGCGSFYSRISYWEDAYAPFTYDSILFFSNSNSYLLGDILTYASNINDIPMSFAAPRDIPAGDSLNVPDFAQSKLVIALDPNGSTRGVYMTRDAANVEEINTSWDLIADGSNSIPNGLSTSVFRMRFSADGNQLYLGMTNGSVYRIDNLNQGNDSLTLDVRSAYSILTCTRIMPGKGAYVSGLAVDPNDANNLIITYPGIGGNAARVYKITNASTALTDQANDVAIQGNLPLGVPVYASVIADHDKNTVVVGTEYGVFATDEAFSSPVPDWYQGWGIPKIAVYDIVQQTNKWLLGDNGPQLIENAHYRKVYLGTHGRGFWKTVSLTGIEEKDNSKTVNSGEAQIQFKVYPNPIRETGFMEIELPENKMVTIEIYDLNGKVVSTVSNSLMPEGLNKIQFNVYNLRNGTYIATVRTNEEMKVSKFVVMK